MAQIIDANYDVSRECTISKFFTDDFYTRDVKRLVYEFVRKWHFWFLKAIKDRHHNFLQITLDFHTRF